MKTYRPLLTTLLLCLAIQTGYAKQLDPQAEFEAGARAFERQSWAAAKTHFDNVIKIQPDNDAAYFNRALARVADAHGGNLDMQDLSDGAPKSVYEASVHDLNKVIQLTPQDADAFMWRAIFHKALGDWPQAIADADRAKALDPEWTEAATAIHGTRTGNIILYGVIGVSAIVLLIGGVSLTRTLVAVTQAEKAAKAAEKSPAANDAGA